MKQILPITLILCCAVTFGQAQTWSIQYDVSGQGFNNIRPRVALTTNNAPVVLWGDDANNIVYTASWNGNGFDPPVRVHSMATDAFTSYWAGPEIAASGDTVFIGLKIMPEDLHGVYSVRSIDGGQTYDDTVRIDDSMDSLTRFPTVAIATGGNPVFAYMKFDMNWMDPQYHVANSSDGGLTFNNDVNGSAQAPGEVCDCCPADLQIQGDRQVLSFRNNENNLRESWAAISNDGGATFPSAKRTDSTGWVIFSCPSVGPDAVLDGDVLTSVYMSAGSGSTKVYVSESNTTSFDIDFQSRLDNWDTVTAFSNYPRIAGDGDVIATVWQNAFFGNLNVYFAWSGAGAAGLVDNIDTVNISTIGNQQSPDIAYADSTFHIVWQDNDSGVVMYRSVKVPYTPTPVANFSFIDDGAGSYTFTDLSINSPTTWLWSFGDGNASTMQNPSYAYPNVDSTYYVSLIATNAGGSDTYGDSLTTTVLGIESFKKQQVMVYPNPFSETTTITFDNPFNEQYQLRIYDIAGRLQTERLIRSSSVLVSADALKPGTYLFVLSGVGQDARGKLIIY